MIDPEAAEAAQLAEILETRYTQIGQLRAQVEALRAQLADENGAGVVAGMWTICDEHGGQANVIMLSDLRVVVINEDGIELWPSEEAFLSADPDGDYAEMLGFIDHEIERPTIDRAVTEKRTRRFGMTTFIPLTSGHIREFVLGHFLLADGYRLFIQRDRIELWGPESSRVLAEIKL